MLCLTHFAFFIEIATVLAVHCSWDVYDQFPCCTQAIPSLCTSCGCRQNIYGIYPYTKVKLAHNFYLPFTRVVLSTLTATATLAYMHLVTHFVALVTLCDYLIYRESTRSLLFWKRKRVSSFMLRYSQQLFMLYVNGFRLLQPNLLSLQYDLSKSFSIM